MTLRSNSAAARDIAFHFHSYTNAKKNEAEGSLVLASGKGIYVYDENGKAYLEGLSGLWCLSLGYGEERLIEAANRQMRKLPYYHTFTQKVADVTVDLAEKLIAIAPVPMSKVFFCNSGSEANDSVVKMVWFYNNALGPAGEEEDHRPPRRLSRGDGGRGLAHGPAAEPPRFRPADRQYPAHRQPAVLPLRQAGRERGAVRDPHGREPGGDDPEGRAGDGRRLHRRAGAWARAASSFRRPPISRRSRRF